MQIDWLTVVAQVVNFLLLVYLLKRFLYEPVTHAMARREQRIAERVRESRERSELADRERQRFNQRLEELEAQREALLEESRKEAEDERRRLLDAAREEAEVARRRWQEQAASEKEQFMQELRRHTAEGFQELARKALGDLAGAELEVQMVRTFAEHLEGLNEEVRRVLSDGDGPLAVTTSFELDAGARQLLTRTIHKHLKPEVEVAYRQSPELLCGIELTAGSRRLGWTLADYLDGFEVRVSDALATAEPTQKPAER